MSQWTLFASPRSPFVRKVTMALHELGLAGRTEMVMVRTTPMAPSPEVVRHNPLGQIPTLLLEDGEMLYDSATILDYLSHLPEGRHLIPGSGVARRQTLHRQAMADGITEKAVRWLDERFRKENKDTAEHIAGYAATIPATLDYFEKRALSSPDGILDAGDISLFCALGYLDFRFAELEWRDSRPELAVWYGGMERRPSAVATQPG